MRIATIRLQIVCHSLSSQRADGQSRPAAWAAEQDAVGSRRDEVVRAAIDAGLSKSEVHRLTGIARTTIDRIIGALPAMEADPR